MSVVLTLFTGFYLFFHVSYVREIWVNIYRKHLRSDFHFDQNSKEPVFRTIMTCTCCAILLMCCMINSMSTKFVATANIM